MERIRLPLGESLYSRVKANLGGRDSSGSGDGSIKGPRALIVNLWRPLRANSDDDWPLALGDSRTFQPDDLVTSKLRYPNRTGETLAVCYGPRQRYDYLSQQQTDEAILLKC